MAQIIRVDGTITETHNLERSEDELRSIIGDDEYVVLWHPTIGGQAMVVGWNAYTDGKRANIIASKIMSKPIWGDVFYAPNQAVYY